MALSPMLRKASADAKATNQGPREFTAAQVIEGLNLVTRTNKAAVKGNLLGVKMPNGKRLGDCTFVEIGEFRAYFTEMFAFIDDVRRRA